MLELCKNEVELLFDLLVESQAQLREEIFHTDSHEFKEALRERAHRIEGILAKLAEAEKHQPV
ncbi:MAG: hypothetical protein ACE5H0_09915 [Bacteroidota bacterium]